MISSSSALETTMLLLAGGPPPCCRSEPETKDLLPKSKGILENFNPVDRCGAPKICLASKHLSLRFGHDAVSSGRTKFPIRYVRCFCGSSC
jgi:hypothetical protein